MVNGLKEKMNFETSAMSGLQPLKGRFDPVSGDAVSSVRLHWIRWRSWSVVGSVLVFLLLLTNIGSAAAASETINIELNRLEDVESGCRMSFVMTNGLETAIDGITMEAVLFDREGIVARFLLLKSRPMPIGKTRVQQFDVADTGCDVLGQVLLNDVTDCAGPALTPTLCLAAIETASRARIPFSTTLTPDSDRTASQ